MSQPISFNIIALRKTVLDMALAPNLMASSLKPRKPPKLSAACVLTPTGVAEKAARTRRFLKRKMAEYEKLREEIEALQLEADQA